MTASTPICFARSIRHGLEHGKACEVDLDRLPPLLRARIDAQKREQERAYRKLMAENAIPQL